MTIESSVHPEIHDFITHLDAAVEAHMDWSRRILRCAVLRTSPGADVLDAGAHTLCQFGVWFTANRSHCDALDAAAAQRIELAHRTMHDAVRALCASILDGKPGRPLDLDEFEQAQSELLGLLARIKTLFLANAARLDTLTGLPLRHSIEHDAGLYQNEARRNSRRLYVGMIDIDHFKRINDRHGHPAGDLVLRHLADTLRRNLRASEPLYRFGGEEFLWLMQCKSTGEVVQSAQRLLDAVRKTPVPVAGSESVLLTITLGIARFHDGEAFASALARADAALYEGKKGGRDCYVIDQP